jgi:hypothetical protein
MMVVVIVVVVVVLAQQGEKYMSEKYSPISIAAAKYI